MRALPVLDWTGWLRAVCLLAVFTVIAGSYVSVVGIVCWGLTSATASSAWRSNLNPADNITDTKTDITEDTMDDINDTMTDITEDTMDDISDTMTDITDDTMDDITDTMTDITDNTMDDITDTIAGNTSDYVMDTFTDDYGSLTEQIHPPPCMDQPPRTLYLGNHRDVQSNLSRNETSTLNKLCTTRVNLNLSAQVVTQSAGDSCPGFLTYRATAVGAFALRDLDLELCVSVITDVSGTTRFVAYSERKLCRDQHSVNVFLMNLLYVHCTDAHVLEDFRHPNGVTMDLSVSVCYTDTFSSSPVPKYSCQWRGTVIVSAVSGAVGSPLQVAHTSIKQGFVAVSGSISVSSDLSFFVRLAAPPGHVIMTSFVYLDIGAESRLPLIAPLCRRGGFLDIFTARHAASSIWPEGGSLCAGSDTDPHLYSAEDLFLRMYLVSHSRKTTGFKLRFSFHNKSTRPQQAPSGRWNCSVPHWHQFRQHFACDLIPQCSDGRDEAPCPYTSPYCGVGFIALGESCYQLLKQQILSWQQAEDVCEDNGRRLASLHTYDINKGMLQLLQRFINVDSAVVFVGLRSPSSDMDSRLYHYVFQWLSGSINYHALFQPLGVYPTCGAYTRINSQWQEHSFPCSQWSHADLANYALCEAADQVIRQAARRAGVQIAAPDFFSNHIEHVRCSSGHSTHSFLSCDPSNLCLPDEASMALSSLCSDTLFTCERKEERVPYTLVCDYRSDCSDGSDEEFCVYEPCGSFQFQCSNRQCISYNERCNGIEQCVDSTDELGCFYLSEGDMCRDNDTSDEHGIRQLYALEWFPVTIDFPGDGFYEQVYRIRNESSDLSGPCPDTHFLCPGSHCLPVSLRCNGVRDCPFHEDEAGCLDYECPGFYRCRNSRICVHAVQICDSVVSCPEHDDELLCDSFCPPGCVCRGHSFFCSTTFAVAEFPDLRSLDASNTDMSPSVLVTTPLLVHASFSGCRLDHLAIPRLPNLRSLNLKNNRLTALHADAFVNVTNLKTLILALNPIQSFILSTRNGILASVETLDVSAIGMFETHPNLSIIFADVRTLNLSQNSIQSVAVDGFQALKKLQVIDLRGNPVTVFPADLFRGLEDLDAVYADNYKLCCPDMLPRGFNPARCWAPSDEISSCQALLRSNVYRTSLAILSVLALLGNLGSFVYRVFFQGVSKTQGFVVFVLHLNVADFVMGVYLAVIGVADRMYMGSYLWHEGAWTKGVPCKAAGFLCLLSSEVSALTICLIALDRAVVIRFPFTRYRFRKRSAHAACLVAWLLGLALASVPLMSFSPPWDFYGQTGICIPLPITRVDFAGHDYSFAVMIVFNFVLFLLIALIQAFIYMAIRSQRMAVTDPTQSATSSQTSKDLRIASNLAVVAVSDFLCWFPIGLLGVLTSSGVRIPGEVNVAMAIFVLPVNSAINPFLYTLSLILGRRQKAREMRLQRLLEQARRRGKEEAGANPQATHADPGAN